MPHASGAERQRTSGSPAKSELAAALRSWRERVTPAQAGLPSGGDRRVPGLRREELALLVGISVDYLVRLEQGRATAPSAQVLGAFSRALKLEPNERELLFRLAGLVPPPAGSVPRVVPRGVQLMIDRMSDTPLAVFSAAWDTVQWNPLWEELLGNPGDLDNRARNLIWRHFADPASSRVDREPDENDTFEREMVADLRRAAERYPDDRGVAELIAALRQENAHFAELWTHYDAVQSSTARKTVVHPRLGPITLDCDVLTIDGHDLRIVLYSAAPGTRGAELLDQLRAISSRRTADRGSAPPPLPSLA
ncbi:helix-turn-helix transcriptional regulator [Gryllotalpicola daejeonensis]|uniref:Helix-turn-helix transcriptional regulator n=1 Tax=Gryllotalpicola daejeonensis TaxID=993087 RepID=A0ABP7ZMY6_9MICO